MKKISLSIFKVGALYIVMVILILLVQRHLYAKEDFFTQINISIFIQLIICLALLFFFRRMTQTESSFRRNAHFLITLNLAMFIVLQFTLVNVDRSRSFYVLSWANEDKIYKSENGFVLAGVVSLEALNSQAINARIEEQIQKKFLSNQDYLIRPTRAGSVLIWTANSLSIIFKLENWKRNKV